jgi:Putative zinc-finger
LKRVDHNSEPLDKILRGAAPLAPGPATPECADPETLAAYYDRSLPQPDRDRLEAHFADCARCQTQLAAIARADEAQASARPRVGVSWLRPRLRIAVPALAAAAVLLIVVRAMRSSINNEFRNGNQIATAKREAPLMELAENTRAPASPPAPASAPAAPASNQLAMNQPAPAAPQALERLPKVREHAKPPVNARPLLKSAPAPKPDLAEVPSAELSRPGVKMSITGAPAPGPVGNGSSSSGAPAGQGYVASLTSEAAALVTITPQEQPARSEDTASSSSRVGAGTGAVAAGNAIGAVTGAATAQSARTFAMNSLPRGPAWMVGKRGLILMRGADGSTRQQNSGVDADLTAGAAPSATVCWVVGRGGTIVRTIDGENWTKVASPTDADLTGVAADSANHAIVTTVAAKNFETTDGGASWHPE